MNGAGGDYRDLTATVHASTYLVPAARGADRRRDRAGARRHHVQHARHLRRRRHDAARHHRDHHWSPPMSVITDTWRQLVRRRLWPVAALLVAALAAVPFLLAKDPEPAPVALARLRRRTRRRARACSPRSRSWRSPARRTAPSAAACSAPATTSSRPPRRPPRRPRRRRRRTPPPTTPPTARPRATAEQRRHDERGSAERGQHRLRRRRGTPAATPAHPGDPGDAGARPTPRRRRPSRRGRRTRSPCASATRPRARAREVDAGAPRARSRPPTTPWPSTSASQDDGETAVFLLGDGVQPTGDGTCLPEPTSCETLALKAGETEFLDVMGDDGATPVAQYELDVVAVHPAKTAAGADDRHGEGCEDAGRRPRDQGPRGRQRAAPVALRPRHGRAEAPLGAAVAAAEPDRRRHRRAAALRRVPQTPGGAAPRGASVRCPACRCASSPPERATGPGLTCIVEGLPAGLELDRESINRDMARRQLGHGRGGRMKIERDTAEVTSGVRHGRTLGGPIALQVANRDYANWEERMSPWPVEADVPEVHLPRPGHADLAGLWKFGFSDVRNVLERASARETAARVAGGALAKAFLRARRRRGRLPRHADRRRARAGPRRAHPRRLRRGRRVARALPGRRRVARDGRGDQRAAQAQRVARRRVRAARLRARARPRLARVVGAAARRAHRLPRCSPSRRSRASASATASTSPAGPAPRPTTRSSTTRSAAITARRTTPAASRAG